MELSRSQLFALEYISKYAENEKYVLLVVMISPPKIATCKSEYKVIVGG
ncbi:MULTISPECIES: hypothetical protein [Bacillus cereus group]|nr:MULTISPECIES: hypothetical protein [Bacillus cereus group]MDR4986026.1 hypothetical protein [Bacillus cereus]